MISRKISLHKSQYKTLKKFLLKQSDILYPLPLLLAFRFLAMSLYLLSFCLAFRLLAKISRIQKNFKRPRCYLKLDRLGI